MHFSTFSALTFSISFSFFTNSPSPSLSHDDSSLLFLSFLFTQFFFYLLILVLTLLLFFLSFISIYFPFYTISLALSIFPFPCCLNLFHSPSLCFPSPSFRFPFFIQFSFGRRQTTHTVTYRSKLPFHLIPYFSKACKNDSAYAVCRSKGGVRCSLHM